MIKQEVIDDAYIAEQIQENFKTGSYLRMHLSRNRYMHYLSLSLLPEHSSRKYLPNIIVFFSISKPCCIFN